MARPMMVDQVRFYASVVRSALVLKFSRIELTWHQSWAMAAAMATYSLRFVGCAGCWRSSDGRRGPGSRTATSW